MTNANVHCECGELDGPVMPGWEYMYHPTLELPYVSHAPGQCQCTNELTLYRNARTGNTRFLCSCCCMGGDVEVQQ